MIKVTRMDNPWGGKGYCLIKEFLNEQQMNEKINLFAEVTLKPGCSLGYHEHIRESETYYVLQGTAAYNDSGTMRTIVKGDTIYVHNNGHSIDNIGKEDLIFMALIIRD